jgi:hypothetical protein
MAKVAIDAPLSQNQKTDYSSHMPLAFSKVYCTSSLSRINTKLAKGKFHYQHMDTKFGSIL